jgi:proteasome lid subunit RPN8/RPN11
MIKWKNEKVDMPFIDLSVFLRKYPLIDALKIIFISKIYPAIVIEKSCKTKIYNHLKSSNMELGGLLVGYVYYPFYENNEFKKPTVIKVCQSIPCSSCINSGVSLKMDSALWNTVGLKISDKNIVVGWYHSHPNLGAFFSGTDRKTQSHFFYHNYSIGLVVDHIRDEERWFVGGKSIEIPQSNVCVE